ncbi:GNAT family N-acetyltransferase [Actinocorallia longicatena]
MTLRPLGPHDREAVTAMHARCSADSRRMRYFSAAPDLAPRLFDHFLERSRGYTVVVEDLDGAVIAMAHLMYTVPGAAELAFLVEDAWQGRGLGRELAGCLIDLAGAEGLTELTASVLSDNVRMRRLFTGLGGTTSRGDDPAVLEITISLGRVALAA